MSTLISTSMADDPQEFLVQFPKICLLKSDQTEEVKALIPAKTFSQFFQLALERVLSTRRFVLCPCDFTA